MSFTPGSTDVCFAVHISWYVPSKIMACILNLAMVKIIIALSPGPLVLVRPPTQWISLRHGWISNVTTSAWYLKECTPVPTNADPTPAVMCIEWFTYTIPDEVKTLLQSDWYRFKTTKKLPHPLPHVFSLNVAVWLVGTCMSPARCEHWSLPCPFISPVKWPMAGAFQWLSVCERWLIVWR